VTQNQKQNPDIALRAAAVADAEALTALAVRSKQSWGYDDAFMTAAQADLAVTEDLITKHHVRVAEVDGDTIGFVTLVIEEREGEILQLFVDPAHHGEGVGQALICKAFEIAAGEGVARVTVESDPNAAPFYEAAGMTVTGDADSIVDPSRKLPVLSWSPSGSHSGSPSGSPPGSPPRKAGGAA